MGASFSRLVSKTAVVQQFRWLPSVEGLIGGRRMQFKRYPYGHKDSFDNLLQTGIALSSVHSHNFTYQASDGLEKLKSITAETEKFVYLQSKPVPYHYWTEISTGTVHGGSTSGNGYLSDGSAGFMSSSSSMYPTCEELYTNSTVGPLRLSYVLLSPGIDSVRRTDRQKRFLTTMEQELLENSFRYWSRALNTRYYNRNYENSISLSYAAATCGNQYNLLTDEMQAYIPPSKKTSSETDSVTVAPPSKYSNWYSAPGHYMIQDIDVLILITLDHPSVCTPSSGVVAAAGICSQDQCGRPRVGSMFLCTQNKFANLGIQKDLYFNYANIIHETAHILFFMDIFSDWVHWNNGTRKIPQTTGYYFSCDTEYIGLGLIGATEFEKLMNDTYGHKHLNYALPPEGSSGYPADAGLSIKDVLHLRYMEAYKGWMFYSREILDPEYSVFSVGRSGGVVKESDCKCPHGSLTEIQAYIDNVVKEEYAFAQLKHELQLKYKNKVSWDDIMNPNDEVAKRYTDAKGQLFRNRIAGSDQYTHYKKWQACMNQVSGPTCSWEVISPNVVKHAREFFDCPTLTGMPVENTGTHASCRAISYHWEQRLVPNEMMAPSGDYKDAIFVSPITLALAEDTGWYLPNYGRATKLIEGLHAGYKKGCSYVYTPCYGPNHYKYTAMEEKHRDYVIGNSTVSYYVIDNSTTVSNAVYGSSNPDLSWFQNTYNKEYTPDSKYATTSVITTTPDVTNAEVMKKHVQFYVDSHFCSNAYEITCQQHVNGSHLAVCGQVDNRQSKVQPQFNYVPELPTAGGLLSLQDWCPVNLYIEDSDCRSTSLYDPFTTLGTASYYDGKDPNPKWDSLSTVGLTAGTDLNLYINRGETLWQFPSVSRNNMAYPKAQNSQCFFSRLSTFTPVLNSRIIAKGFSEPQILLTKNDFAPSRLASEDGKVNIMGRYYGMGVRNVREPSAGVCYSVECDTITAGSTSSTTGTSSSREDVDALLIAEDIVSNNPTMISEINYYRVMGKTDLSGGTIIQMAVCYLNSTTGITEFLPGSAKVMGSKPTGTWEAYAKYVSPIKCNSYKAMCNRDRSPSLFGGLHESEHKKALQDSGKLLDENSKSTTTPYYSWTETASVCFGPHLENPGCTSACPKWHRNYCSIVTLNWEKTGFVAPNYTASNISSLDTTSTAASHNNYNQAMANYRDLEMISLNQLPEQGMCLSDKCSTCMETHCADTILLSTSDTNSIFLNPLYNATASFQLLSRRICWWHNCREVCPSCGESHEAICKERYKHGYVVDYCPDACPVFTMQGCAGILNPPGMCTSTLCHVCQQTGEQLRLAIVDPMMAASMQLAMGRTANASTSPKPPAADSAYPFVADRMNITMYLNQICDGCTRTLGMTPNRYLGVTHKHRICDTIDKTEITKKMETLTADPGKSTEVALEHFPRDGSSLPLRSTTPFRYDKTELVTNAAHFRTRSIYGDQKSKHFNEKDAKLLDFLIGAGSKTSSGMLITLDSNFDPRITTAGSWHTIYVDEMFKNFTNDVSTLYPSKYDPDQVESAFIETQHTNNKLMNEISMLTYESCHLVYAKDNPTYTGEYFPMFSCSMKCPFFQKNYCGVPIGKPGSVAAGKVDFLGKDTTIVQNTGSMCVTRQCGFCILFCLESKNTHFFAAETPPTKLYGACLANHCQKYCPNRAKYCSRDYLRNTGSYGTGGVHAALANQYGDRSLSPGTDLLETKYQSLANRLFDIIHINVPRSPSMCRIPIFREEALGKYQDELRFPKGEIQFPGGQVVGSSGELDLMPFLYPPLKYYESSVSTPTNLDAAEMAILSKNFKKEMTNMLKSGILKYDVEDKAESFTDGAEMRLERLEFSDGYWHPLVFSRFEGVYYPKSWTNVDPASIDYRDVLKTLNVRGDSLSIAKRFCKLIASACAGVHETVVESGMRGAGEKLHQTKSYTMLWKKSVDNIYRSVKKWATLGTTSTTTSPGSIVYNLLNEVVVSSTLHIMSDTISGTFFESDKKESHVVPSCMKLYQKLQLLVLVPHYMQDDTVFHEYFGTDFRNAMRETLKNTTSGTSRDITPDQIEIYNEIDVAFTTFSLTNVVKESSRRLLFEELPFDEDDDNVEETMSEKEDTGAETSGHDLPRIFTREVGIKPIEKELLDEESNTYHATKVGPKTDSHLSKKRIVVRGYRKAAAKQHVLSAGVSSPTSEDRNEEECDTKRSLREDSKVTIPAVDADSFAGVRGVDIRPSEEKVSVGMLSDTVVIPDAVANIVGTVKASATPKSQSDNRDHHGTVKTSATPKSQSDNRDHHHAHAEYQLFRPLEHLGESTGKFLKSDSDINTLEARMRGGVTSPNALEKMRRKLAEKQTAERKEVESLRKQRTRARRMEEGRLGEDPFAEEAGKAPAKDGRVPAKEGSRSSRLIRVQKTFPSADLPSVEDNIRDASVSDFFSTKTYSFTKESNAKYQAVFEEGKRHLPEEDKYDHLEGDRRYLSDASPDPLPAWHTLLIDFNVNIPSTLLNSTIRSIGSLSYKNGVFGRQFGKELNKQMQNRFGKASLGSLMKGGLNTTEVNDFKTVQMANTLLTNNGTSSGGGTEGEWYLHSMVLESPNDYNMVSDQYEVIIVPAHTSEVFGATVSDDGTVVNAINLEPLFYDPATGSLLDKAKYDAKYLVGVTNASSNDTLTESPQTGNGNQNGPELMTSVMLVVFYALMMLGFLRE